MEEKLKKIFKNKFIRRQTSEKALHPEVVTHLALPIKFEGLTMSALAWHPKMEGVGGWVSPLK